MSEPLTPTDLDELERLRERVTLKEAEAKRAYTERGDHARALRDVTVAYTLWHQALARRSHALIAAARELEALRAERDELAATLANERVESRCVRDVNPVWTLRMSCASSPFTPSRMPMTETPDDKIRALDEDLDLTASAFRGAAEAYAEALVAEASAVRDWAMKRRDVAYDVTFGVSIEDAQQAIFAHYLTHQTLVNAETKRQEAHATMMKWHTKLTQSTTHRLAAKLP